MRNELNFLHVIFMDNTTYPINKIIFHLIDRHPGFTVFGDACLETYGGFSYKSQFWWHLEFSQEIKYLALKQYIVLTRNKLTDKLVSINILEFITEIVKCSAIFVVLSHNATILNTEFLVFLNWIDNNTTNYWTQKAATKSEKSRALQQILCGLVINSTLKLQSQ